MACAEFALRSPPLPVEIFVLGPMVLVVAQRLDSKIVLMEIGQIQHVQAQVINIMSKMEIITLFHQEAHVLIIAVPGTAPLATIIIQTPIITHAGAVPAGITRLAPVTLVVIIARTIVVILVLAPVIAIPHLAVVVVARITVLLLAPKTVAVISIHVFGTLDVRTMIPNPVQRIVTAISIPVITVVYIVQVTPAHHAPRSVIPVVTVLHLDMENAPPSAQTAILLPVPAIAPVILV
ncbi:membrane hypothetical protein [Gammaproteobacteria bacterium]